MQAPLGSVIIPTYNSGSLVAEAVASVLLQTVGPDEIIVVDDGSTDDTVERLEPHWDRIRYIRQENQGVSAARNRGIEEARGEFIGFLDADDVWHPRKWELQMRVFRDRPDIGMIGTHLFGWPGPVFPLLHGADTSHITPVTWCELVVRNYLITSSVAVRRSILDRAGRFDTALQGPEDRDLWIRVAEVASIANLELPLTGYRDVQGSVSKQAQRCEEGMFRILEKLDLQKAWRGRWLLRRKAYSYVYHSCAYLHSAAGAYRRAVINSSKSLVWYPLPYSRREVKTLGERPKRMVVNMRRWLGLKSDAFSPSSALEATRAVNHCVPK